MRLSRLLSHKTWVLLALATGASLGAMQEPEKIKLTPEQEQKFLEEQKCQLREIIEAAQKFPGKTNLGHLTYYCPLNKTTQTKTIATKIFQDIYALAGGKGTIAFHTKDAFDLPVKAPACTCTHLDAGIVQHSIFVDYQSANAQATHWPRNCLYVLSPWGLKRYSHHIHEYLTIHTLLHELGHAIRNHTYTNLKRVFIGLPQTMKQSLRNEHEANLFPLFMVAAQPHVQKLLNVSCDTLEQAVTTVETSCDASTLEMPATGTQFPIQVGTAGTGLSPRDPDILWLQKQLNCMLQTTFVGNWKTAFQNEQFRELYLQACDLRHPTPKAHLQTLAWFNNEFRDELKNPTLWGERKITFHAVCKRFLPYFEHQYKTKLWWKVPASKKRKRTTV